MNMSAMLGPAIPRRCRSTATSGSTSCRRSARTGSCSSIPRRRRGARTWSRPVPTATSGGTKSCSCRRSGRSMPISSTSAMRAIKVQDEEMARLAREQDLEVMKPELGSHPRVYYRNLWRYSKCFIGGTLAAETNGVVDCVEGASVRLSKDGRTIAETTSDNYGDFKFDKLDEGSGTYLVEISAKGRNKKSVEARLGASINLGEIRL